ncbi:MAG: hypothetical protein ACYTG4_00260 [Planctomycetota bacterium]|jgi:hypothetical protein
MKKKIAAIALLFAASTALSGCYLSRQVAGDELTGGPTNPYLWVTVPLDTVLFPFEMAHFINHDDSWTPWSADAIKEEYVDQYKFPGE